MHIYKQTYVCVYPYLIVVQLFDMCMSIVMKTATRLTILPSSAKVSTSLALPTHTTNIVTPTSVPAPGMPICLCCHINLWISS